ncbi:MAG: hypothetical protein KDE31_24920 [Caldilineaceae bacterium]|nr:hypothetical protein [Caldilineaceae bacterium]
MAEIVVFNVPGSGHVNPTLPVVAELVARGHAVRYFNTARFQAAIERTGAAFRSYPNGAMMEVAFMQRAGNLATISSFLLQESERLLPWLCTELAKERPDLVLFDAIALWGMQVARLQQLPSVASIGLFIFEGTKGLIGWRDTVHQMRQALPHIPALLRSRRRLTRRYGAKIFPSQAIFPAVSDCNLVYTSREFQPDSSFVNEHFHFVGPSIAHGVRGDSDFPWHELDGSRPRVYLSLGTIYNDNLTFYRQVLETFADYPAQFIVALGRQVQIEALGAIPANFLIQPTVPQLELLPKVDLFISHGGMNSVNEALYFGVPLVIVPQQIEQMLNGRQSARKGAAILLGARPPYGQVAMADLCAAITTVLHEPAFGQAATRLGDSFRAAGGYRRAVQLIEQTLHR